MSDTSGSAWFEVRPDPPVLEVHGEVDVVCKEEFAAAVDRLLDVAPRGPVTFDLGGVTFMDSSALSVLIGASNRGREVVVRNASTMARKVLVATGLTEVLGVQP